MKRYAIARLRAGETEYYGPIFGSQHPEWTAHIASATQWSNKAHARQEATRLQQPHCTVVELGDFAGVANRVLRVVYTLKGDR